MVCGARASHSAAGVHTALMAAAAAQNTTTITIVTARPRRIFQRCSLSTAGDEQQREEQRDRDRDEDILREVEQRPDRQEREHDDGFAQRGVGERSGCAHKSECQLLTDTGAFPCAVP